jgi:hypothetical protein
MNNGGQTRFAFLARGTEVMGPYVRDTDTSPTKKRLGDIFPNPKLSAELHRK